MVAVELVMLFSRHGWGHEWDWALSQAAAGTLLLAPLTAGLVAVDRARRVETTVALLASSSSRGAAAIAALPLASWLWAVAAWLLGVVVAIVVAWRGEAAGPPDPFGFVEAPVLLLLAAFVGLAVGSSTRSVLAGPVAAIIVFLARLLPGSWGLHLDGVFAAGGATGSLIALDRAPQVAVALLAVHLAIAGSAASLATARLRAGTQRRPVVVPLVSAVLVAAALIAYAATASRQAPYRWTSSPQVCERGFTTVCGPRKGAYLVRVAERSLSAAEVRLQHSGIGWRRTYVVPRGQAIEADDGLLAASADAISGGGLSPDAVAATLATPRLCLAFFDARSAQPLLDDQARVRQWVQGALSSPRPVGPAPQSVREAYGRLTSCPPFTSPLP